MLQKKVFSPDQKSEGCANQPSSKMKTMQTSNKGKNKQQTESETKHYGYLKSEISEICLASFSDGQCRSRLLSRTHSGGDTEGHERPGPSDNPANICWDWIVLYFSIQRVLETIKQVDFFLSKTTNRLEAP